VEAIKGVRLEVPYKSQESTTANSFRNDCGPACVAMISEYKIPNLEISVNQVASKTSLKKKDNGILPAEIIQLLGAQKIQSYAKSGIALEDLRNEIDSDRPVILLVNYKYLGDRAFGHYVVLVGYNEAGFYIHDPYKRGAFHFMPTEEFEKSITDVGAFFYYNRQGVLLK